MEREKQKGGGMVKATLVMYIITGLLLVLLAFIVSKSEREETVARIGIIAIYVISCMLGGYIIGKIKKTRKFLWGLLAGSVYVTILLAVGIIVGMGTLPELVTALTSAAVCMAAGMLGGMIS